MKRTVYNLALILIVLFSLNSLVVNAQEYTGTNYYYNNFDNGQIGSSIVKTSPDASLGVLASGLLNGTYSLSSLGNGKAGVYQLNTISKNTNLNDEQFGWEWNLLFSSSLITTEANNTWKYWLTQETNQVDSKGMYLTQEGNKLFLKYMNSKWDTRSWEIMTIAANTIYAIRVQRLTNRWQVFVDTYATAPNGAYTLRTNTGSKPDGGQFYASKLEVQSSVAGCFKFDDLRVYSLQFKVTGANDSSNGITNPILAGQQNAIMYGLKVETRGYFEIYQFVVDLEGDVWSMMETGANTGKLYKSKDSFFGNIDDVLMTTIDIYAANFQKYGFNAPFYSFGTQDGNATAQYLYVTANIKTPLASGLKYNIKGISKFQSEYTGINYVSVSGTIENVKSEPIISASIKDWTGTKNTTWDDANNWSPTGVPSYSDFIQIGVKNFTNQPSLTQDVTASTITFGTAKVATLTIASGKSLTADKIDSKAGINISGNGTLNVKNSFNILPIANTTLMLSTPSYIKQLVLDNKDYTIDIKSNASLGILDKIVSVGTKTSSFIQSSNAILLLYAENALDINTNLKFDLAGSVIYKSEVSQNIYTNLNYKNISFAGNGLKNVLSGTLNISGNWTSADGKVDLLTNNVTLNFNGTNQSIIDEGTDNGAGLYFANITLSGSSKTLSKSGKFALAPNKSLTLAANTTLQTSDNLVLKANKDNTAWVAAIPSTSAIKGKVVVEKYIQGGDKNIWRTNRMFSSPVYDNTSDFVNSDVTGNRSYKFTQFIDDMLVTGVGGAKNGFDNSTTNAASAWTYNNGFVGIPNINTTLNVGYGAFIYYRGDRSNLAAKFNAPFVDAESMVMTFEGVLNQQDITITLVNGLNMIGNPYAASIDWNMVIKDQAKSKVIKIWNPSNRQYSNFDGSYGTNGGTNIIGPGQAFFVNNVSGQTITITFKESTKVKVSKSQNYNKVMSVNNGSIDASMLGGDIKTNNLKEEESAVVRVKIQRENTANSDEAIIVFKKDEVASFTADDVERLGGEEILLSSLSAEKKQLAINYMPHISEVSNVNLGVTAVNSGNFNLKFNLNDIPTGYTLKLRDNYLKTTTDIVDDNLDYTFKVDKSIASTSGLNRFEILVSPITTLPVVLKSFKGIKVNEGVKLNWATAQEINNNHFELYRADNKLVYTKIANIAANNSSEYNLIDRSPVKGNNYYKLVQVDNDGKENSFNPIVVNYDLDYSSNFVVYPNVVEQDFSINYTGNLSSSSNYELIITDLSGKVVMNKVINNMSLINVNKQNISNLVTGFYFVNLLDLKTGRSIGNVKIHKK